ncbi:MAG: hypothetical protein COB83_08740 [Gammaproteobacteria bacterium]|nr:MAG: hypothetical protein COB83_08740 [Gammaproteobacteria bacterium]
MSCDGESYVDYAMSSSSDDATVNSAVDETNSVTDEAGGQGFVTGICHAKGANADIPAAWLPYFLVADIELAVSAVESEGGELLTKIKPLGNDKYVVIKDPAGAQCALYQKVK